MALGAAAGAVEILLSGLRVAGLQIGDIDGAAVAFERVRLVFRVVDERHDGGEVGVGKVGCGGMPLSIASVANERSDFVAAHVLGDERRAGEVGPGLAAHRVAAVTEAAVGGKQPLPALHELGADRSAA